MSESPRERRSPLLVPVVIAGLLVAYVLSIGPVTWIVGKAGWDFDSWQVKGLRAFYLPVIYGAGLTKTERLLQGYTELFDPR